MGTSKTRLCPSCGLYYAEVPAVSRKNPKVAICPECGLKEALEAASFAKMFAPTIAAFEKARREAGCSVSL